MQQVKCYLLRYCMLPVRLKTCVRQKLAQKATKTGLVQTLAENTTSAVLTCGNSHLNK